MNTQSIAGTPALRLPSIDARAGGPALRNERGHNDKVTSSFLFAWTLKYSK
jgi:hypothetical protein